MDLLDHLRARRSSLSLTLEEPGPSAPQLADMLTIAARVPDHGKLEPWRFELWEPEARKRMHGELVALIDSKAEDAAKLRGGTDKLLHAPSLVAVISQARAHEKIPEWEQTLSAGAVCLNLLHAANAQGFEAQWLTAWYIYDERAASVLSLEDGERIAGLIHIGSTSVAKTERPRPALDTIFSIREA
jgi:nitroreductase